MTTALDNEILPEVLSILDEYGATAKFYISAPGTYDSIQGEFIPGIVTEYPDIKVIPPFKADKKYGIAGVETGNNVTEKETLVSGIAGNSAFVPTMDNTVFELNGEKWHVDKVSSIYSGDNIALYLLYVWK